MKYHEPLKQILSRTRSHWDQDATRPAVRWAFGKALQCRTPELGAEVYGSENQERTFYHPCKSRACPSYGYRATVQRQRGLAARNAEHPSRRNNPASLVTLIAA